MRNLRQVKSRKYRGIFEVRSRTNHDRSGEKLHTELDLHRFTSGFYGAFATGVECQLRTITLLDTWFHLPFWD